MLVLSRKIGESLVLDGGIVITVVDIRGFDARIGIEAPREVPVHRSEIAAVLAERGERFVTPGKGGTPARRYDPATGTYGPGPETTRDERNRAKQRERGRRQ